MSRHALTPRPQQRKPSRPLKVHIRDVSTDLPVCGAIIFVHPYLFADEQNTPADCKQCIRRSQCRRK